MKKVYISVPISGRDIGTVKAEILKASEAAAERGWTPVSPLDGVTDYTLPWIEYIIADLRTLSGCDAICLTGGWRESCGCRIEREAAARLGLGLLLYDTQSGKLLTPPCPAEPGANPPGSGKQGR